MALDYPVEVVFAEEDGALWFNWRGLSLPREQFGGHFLPALKEDIGLPASAYFDQIDKQGTWRCFLLVEFNFSSKFISGSKLISMASPAVQ